MLGLFSKLNPIGLRRKRRKGETEMADDSYKRPLVCLSKRHGNHHAYRAYRCRCPETFAFMAKVQREGRERRQAGTAGVVDATPTLRRLQALVAAGWTCQELAGHLGYSTRQAVKDIMESPRVYRATHDKVEALYSALQALPGPSQLNRQRSRRKGWAVPFAWDDETIADPEAQPDHGAPRRGWLPAKELLYEYQQIRDSGMTHAYALKELGVKHDAWEAAMKKLGLNEPKTKQAPEPTRRAINGSLHGMGIT